MMNKDEEILFHLSQCNLLTRDHIAKLTKRDHSWLDDSLRRMVSQKKIYMKDRGRFLPRVYARYDISKRETFDHDLSLADLYTATYLTGKLLDWSQPKQKFESDLNEDVTKVIQAGQREITYSVEYETGKNNRSHIFEVHRRYMKLREDEFFNVLWILRDETHKKLSTYIQIGEDLLKSKRYQTYHIDKPSTHKLFLYVLQKDYLEDPIGKVCRIPVPDHKTGNFEKYSIAPNLIK